MISISLGPARESIPVDPKISFLAVVTNIFPGPEITSTLLISLVPKAKAPIA